MRVSVGLKVGMAEKKNLSVVVRWWGRGAPGTSYIKGNQRVHDLYPRLGLRRVRVAGR